jgi:hypothetical protein
VTIKNTFEPANMLESYRGNANDFMRKQVAQFKQLSPGDQREFLFFMMANMAISQAAIIDSMVVMDASQPDPKEQMQ